MGFWTMPAKTNQGWIRSHVYELAATGILMGLILAIKYLFGLIPSIPPHISISPAYFFAAMAVYLLKNRVFGLVLVFVSPLLWLAVGRALVVSVPDFILEYELPVLALFGAALIPLFEKKQKPTARSWACGLLFFLVTMAGLRLLLVTVAGQLYYGLNLYGSLVYNWPNVLTDAGLSIALFALAYPGLAALRRTVK